MKKIEISDSHREKIIHMILALTKADDVGSYHNGWEYDIDKEYFDIDYEMSLHWLEICIFHLMPALNLSMLSYEKHTHEGRVPTHLVDYLYYVYTEKCASKD